MLTIRLFNTYEPASPIYRDLVPKLSSNGYNVEIVVSRGEYRKGRNLDEAFDGIDNVRIVKTQNLGMHPYKSKIQKLLVSGMYLVSTFFLLIFSGKNTTNVFLTQPPFINVLGLVAYKLLGKKYCCIVMDLQPQEAIEFGSIKKDGILAKSLKWLSSKAYKNSVKTAVIGRCMFEEVRKVGVHSERITFIPNWVDESAIFPVDSSENVLRQKLGLENKFIVFYGGNIGNAQNYDDILECSLSLKDVEQIMFVFIGSGSKESHIDDFITNNNLSNVIRIPLLHETYDLSTILSVGDVHYISLRDSCTGLAVPSKTYASLAVGRPIIYQGKSEGEIARMVKEEDIGFVVDNGDPQSLKERITFLFENKETKDSMGKRARQSALGGYSGDESSRKYYEFIESVIELGKKGI